MANTIDLSTSNVGRETANVTPRQQARNNVNAAGYTVWADITSATISGKLFNVELVKNNESEFLAFTIITALQDGDATGTTVSFNSSDRGLMKLFSNGHLPNGRRMTAVGQIKEVRSHYVNKDGVIVPLKRPQIAMKGVTLQLGAKPASRNRVN